MAKGKLLIFLLAIHFSIAFLFPNFRGGLHGLVVTASQARLAKKKGSSETGNIPYVESSNRTALKEQGKLLKKQSELAAEALSNEEAKLRDSADTDVSRQKEFRKLVSDLGLTDLRNTSIPNNELSLSDQEKQSDINFSASTLQLPEGFQEGDDKWWYTGGRPLESGAERKTVEKMLEEEDGWIDGEHVINKMNENSELEEVPLDYDPLKEGCVEIDEFGEPVSSSEDENDEDLKEAQRFNDESDDFPHHSRCQIIAVVTNSSTSLEGNNTAIETVQKIYNFLRNETKNDARIAYHTYCIMKDNESIPELENTFQMWIESYNNYHLVDGLAMKELWGGVVPEVILSEKNLGAILNQVQMALFEDSSNATVLSPGMRRLRLRGGVEEVTSGINAQHFDDDSLTVVKL